MSNPDTPLCVDQTRDSYNDIFRMLQASPGDEIYFGYTENGHLSKTFEGIDTTIKIYYKLKIKMKFLPFVDFDSFLKLQRSSIWMMVTNVRTYILRW